MKKIKLIKVFGSILGLAAISFFGVNIYSNYQKSTNYIHASYIVDFDDDKKLSGFSDNIFIGKIIENLGTKSKEKESGNIPDTLFKVEILNNIKGKLSGKVIVTQEGGYDENGDLYIMEGSKLLNKGEIYLLATKGNSFTIISHKNGSHLIANENNLKESEIKKIIIENKDVINFREAYKNEVYYQDGRKISSEKNAYKNLSKIEKDNFENIENGFVK